MIRCPACDHCFHLPDAAEAKFNEMVEEVKRRGLGYLMTWDHFVPASLAADFLGKSEKTLNNWRYNYEHKHLFRQSGRSIQYSLREIAEFITN